MRTMADGRQRTTNSISERLMPMSLSKRSSKVINAPISLRIRRSRPSRTPA